MKVKLLAHTPEPEKIIAIAARLCYSNKADIETIAKGFTKEEIQGFIWQLMSSRHYSALEHASFTFGIEGISRTVSHELVRHRLMSFSQRSQRYCAEGECEFVEPKTVKISDASTANVFHETLFDTKNGYLELLRHGVPKEDARYVLPNATETRLILTANARELLHFFALRCCQRALPEMQDLANAMLKEVRPAAPTIFANAGPSCAQLGYCSEGSRSCGRVETLEKILKGYAELKG